MYVLYMYSRYMYVSDGFNVLMFLQELTKFKVDAMALKQVIINGEENRDHLLNTLGVLYNVYLCSL